MFARGGKELEKSMSHPCGVNLSDFRFGFLRRKKNGQSKKRKGIKKGSVCFFASAFPSACVTATIDLYKSWGLPRDGPLPHPISFSIFHVTGFHVALPCTWHQSPLTIFQILVVQQYATQISTLPPRASFQSVLTFFTCSL